jgi:hypothetical protein
MSMSEKNLAVLLTAKKSAVSYRFATSVAKPVGKTKPVPPQSDGTREWLAFRTECVVLKKKGV